MVEIITDNTITKHIDYFSTITQFKHLKKINIDTYFYSQKNLNKIKMKFINFNYKINFIIVSNKLKNKQKI
jgi:sulfur relay (sulfurtransferase) DsrF/TusC family protein